MPALAAAEYGKDNVRVYKVHRDPATGVHTVYEMTVTILLQGAIETSYTRADNSVVVPTDTMKQTTYILAKQHDVHPPELFAATLASHFVTRYPHIHVATATVVQHRWTRMHLNGDPEPHPHAFYRDGAEKRVAKAVARQTSAPGAAAANGSSNGASANGSAPSTPLTVTVHSAIRGLLVLKSTGSAFHGFDQSDSFTQLKPTNDRILSTEVDAGWTWQPWSSPSGGSSPVDAILKCARDGAFDQAWTHARDITLRTFATDASASVQATMYKMCELILKAAPLVQAVDYALPNKHYFEIDLSWHDGLKNTGSDAEVYQPQSDPNGLIRCTVSRDAPSH